MTEKPPEEYPLRFPLVSVVTLNWNGVELTSQLLKSIKEKCSYPHLEVIVADNGSEIDPTAALEAEYPGTKVVLNGANLGFAAGNNAALGIARGEYIFFVNNDTEFTEGLIEGLIEVFHTIPRVGIVCPKFHYYFHPNTIEFAGATRINPFTGRNSIIGQGTSDEGQYQDLREIHYAHGGAMMVSAEVLQKVGPMAEDFFLYYEELDWSERIKRAGYKIFLQPQSLILHKESMSTGKASPLKTYYHTRNRILFMKRNMPLHKFLIFIIFFITFTIPKNTFTFLVGGRREHLGSFWRGILWHLNDRFSYRSNS